jgi:hypothetical protein
MFADNRDTADVLEGKSSEIMSQTEFRVFDLALVRAAVQLQIHFIEHS